MRHLILLLVFSVVSHFSQAREVSFSRNFKRIGSKYYYISDSEKLDWYDAHNKCKSMNANLVSIKNFNEWDAITDHLTRCKSYWVDIIINNDDEFISETTGVEAPYLKWAKGQPNMRYDYECVKLQRGCHCMKTKYCSQENYYICEANMTPAPTTHKPEKPYDIIDLRYDLD